MKAPVCRECRREFYYDYQPSPNDDTGYCLNCWLSFDKTERQSQKNATMQPEAAGG